MEDYKKKYQEALERAKICHRDLMDYDGVAACMAKCFLEKAFPELVESDEMIRKAVFDFFSKGAENGEQTNGIYDKDILAWLEKQKEPEDKGEISDGYHTFNELYRYRMLYNAAFFNLLPKEWVHKSRKHHDGEECFGGGWFIVMANLPTGQISNHYELKDWDLFQVPEKEVADRWDGHTPQEVAERLHKYLLLEKKEEKKYNIPWHSASEEPKEQYEILCEWESDDATWYDVVFYHANDKTFWRGRNQIENVIRWTYIYEIINSNEMHKP